ncbi:hypothetical protein GGF32_001085 [Allomyces javanicus]|nr:hypothetical protein GGF32_001085 [Allomyces javanicus]
MAGAHSKHGHGKRGARRGAHGGGNHRRGPKPIDWADLIPAKMHHARKTLHQAARKAKQFEAQKLIKKLKSDPSNTVLASRLDRVKHAHLADLADHWFHRLLSTTPDLRAWADKFVPTTSVVPDDAETVSLLKGSKAVRDGLASIAADLTRLVARSLGKTVEAKPVPAANGAAESDDAASSSDEETDSEDVVMADDAPASSGFSELGAEDLVRSGDEVESSDDEDGDSSDDKDGVNEDGSSDDEDEDASSTADADVAITPDFTDPIVRAALRAAQKRSRADSSSESDDADDDSDDHVSWSSDDEEDVGSDADNDMYDSDGELIPEAERAQRRAAKAMARPALDDSDDEDEEGGKKEEKKKKRKNRPGQQARKKRFLERTGQAPPPPPTRGRGRGRGRGESGPGVRTFDGHGPASASSGGAPFRGNGRGAPAARGAPPSRGGFAGRGGAPPSRGGFADRSGPSSRGGFADRGASAPRGGFAGRGGPSSRGAPAARGSREDATAGNLHPSWEAKRAERERLQALAAAPKPTKIVFDNDD